MKSKIGIIGFLIWAIGTIVSVIYKYFFQIELDLLFEISFLIGLSCFTIDWEYKKETPRLWYIYLVSVISLIMIFVLFYLYN